MLCYKEPYFNYLSPNAKLALFQEQDNAALTKLYYPRFSVAADKYHDVTVKKCAQLSYVVIT